MAAEDRGQILWFSPPIVHRGDLDPSEPDPRRRDELIPVLEIVFVPGASVPAGASWASLVTPAGDVDASSARYLEIWINDYINFSRLAQRTGTLVIDIGTVSEDAVWDPLTPPRPQNGVLDYEDRNRSGGTIELAEDTGLDGLWSRDEPPRPAGAVAFTPFSAAEDPAADDRVPEIDVPAPEATVAQRIQKYAGINGTEFNKAGDSEDLDGDFFLDLENWYFEYRIDQDTPALFDAGRDLGVTDPENGWRFYRIPLTDPDRIVGTPDLRALRSVRIWFTAQDTVDLQIAGLRLVDATAVIPDY
jgi:cell surface protein SprA